ncbi:MAG: chitobiase/beta-hexosaminidase C-terminal domain-containing protein [Oscillospiraceae bacterium]|nr:chitobiase/beta-hexosaminidase C-terminal domain-containing protein [Oscillospiraceae bacterium]
MKKVLIVLLVLVLLAAVAIGLLYFFWTAENLAAYADKKMAEGDYEKAVEYYDKAVNLDPGNTAYALSLADASLQLGSYTRAERALVNAIRTAPKLELYLALSELYVAQDKLMDAEKLLSSVTDSAIRAQIDAMRPAAPQLSPESGEYDSYISVTMEAAGAAVYYSTDREYPSLDRTAYTEPVALSAGDTGITAIAVGDNGLVSTLSEANYRIVGVIEEISFASPELEAMVRELLYLPDASPVLTSDLWDLTELTVPETVTDYSDLRYFTSLTALTIQNSSVEDYSFLPALTKLAVLDLSGSLISAETLDHIGTLSTLTTLRLRGCGLSNILPLAQTTAITELDLADNSITNIGVLANYTGLVTADLSSNAISDLSALAGLTQIASLNLSANDLLSIEALSGCTGMQELNISGNKVSSLTPLQGMTQLKTLRANKNSITSISALAGCLQLSHLDVADNALTEIAVVGNLPALNYLDFSHNEVTELPTFSAATHLQQFYAAYNQLTDISNLSIQAELTYVDVDYNEELEDIECLQTCPLLVQVDAFGTKVKEVSALTAYSVIVNYDPSDPEDDE